MSSEYQIKLEAIKEFEDALKYKKMYDDLTHELAGLLSQILTVLSRNSTSLKDRETLERALERVRFLVQSKVDSCSSPEVKRSPFSPEDGTEPNEARDYTSASALSKSKISTNHDLRTALLLL